MTTRPEANDESSVRALYQDERVAQEYIQERFASAWGRLLHERQSAILNRLIESEGLRSALELAPGPARLAVDLLGLTSGVMVEGSSPMVDIARRRLREANRLGVWDVRHGNAFDLGALDPDFDLAFAFRFIRHMHREDRERLYRQIFGRLRPGGFLVVDVVNRQVREELDARAQDGSPSALAVHDALHTKGEIRDEMAAAGFSVQRLHPVIRHFEVQAFFSHRVAPRLPRLARGLVRTLEWVPSGRPLEWVCVCRKVDSGAREPEAS